MIRTIGLVLLVFSSSYVTASPPIEEVKLTPKIAKDLGFKVKVGPEGEATMVEISGPPEINSGCKASRSGNFILEENGEEVAVYITELPHTSEPPKAIGYIANSTPNTMGVFIDYFCPGKRAYESRRYAISSIRAWSS